jgi:hypothetical protein
MKIVKFLNITLVGLAKQSNAVLLQFQLHKTKYKALLSTLYFFINGLISIRQFNACLYHSSACFIPQGTTLTHATLSNQIGGGMSTKDKSNIFLLLVKLKIFEIV